MNDLSALHIRFWDRPEDGGNGKEMKNSTEHGDRVGVATIFDLLRLKFWKKHQPASSSVSSMSV